MDKNDLIFRLGQIELQKLELDTLKNLTIRELNEVIKKDQSDTDKKRDKRK